MGFYDRFHVWHTRIRNLDGHSVKYLVVLAATREMFVYQVQKLLCNVGLDITGEGWVEPQDFPLSPPLTLRLYVFCIFLCEIRVSAVQ